jgi:ketosteroid isomerase-like protein
MRWLAPLALLVWIPGLLEAQQPTAAAEAEVLDAVHGFHDALAAFDSTAALRHLHPEVVIYEGGHAETLDEYRGGHLPADMAFATGTLRERTAESVRLWGEQALYTSESHTTGRWRDRDIDARGTETMVLVRTPDGWRILHIHWSSR